MIRITLMYQEIKQVREVHQDFEAGMCADVVVRMLAVMRSMDEYIRERDLPYTGSLASKRMQDFVTCTKHWLKNLDRCFEEKHTGIV